MRSHSILITEAELSASSSERVYHWLETQAAKAEQVERETDKDVEKALLDRNDSLIDIGLARFAKYGDTAEKLFARAKSINSNNAHERALRLALLSNEAIDSSFVGMPDSLFAYGSDEKMAWLVEADPGEVFALFQNPKISDSFLRDFLECKEPWLALDEPRRLIAVRALAKNKRMQAAYSGGLDGYAEYSHDSVFFAAWKLAETLPPTREWANVLGDLFERTPRESLHMDAPLTIAQRWQAQIGDERAPKDESNVAKSGCLGPYQIVRKSLAQLAASKNADLRDHLLCSDDAALRAAAYELLAMTREQILAAYDRDKNLAVNLCQCNDQIWCNPESRQALHDISWTACEFNDNYMDTADAFNYFKADRQKKHPQWFKDEADEIDASNLTATKSDIETLTEAIDANEVLIREGMTMTGQIAQAIGDANKRLGWVWWFSLGALVATGYRHL